MDVKFDHLVHFSYNPNELKEQFCKLGFHAIDGGKHEEWGTYNCLCYFNALRYIEWIGVENESIANKTTNPLIQQVMEDYKFGESFSQLAFRTENMNHLFQHVKNQGLTPIGPFPGSRKKTNGKVIQWSLLFVKDENELGRFPFFIEWKEDDCRRAEELDSLASHQHGRASLEYICFFVANQQNVIDNYQRLFQIKKDSIHWRTDSFGTYEELNIGGISLRFYQTFKNRHLKASHPILCGVKTTAFEQIAMLNNGMYHFYK
ncbi:VOC family protein [Bacillus andreraoultii]|uniref:VOC family protein n=1 Tax=Bacillus andreraoultii TaxID=1499685 RepID=UPI00053ADEF3|nr:VOC family protein [Bacillus andreraoultii]